jgi:hypothetical protein
MNYSKETAPAGMTAIVKIGNKMISFLVLLVFQNRMLQQKTKPFPKRWLMPLKLRVMLPKPIQNKLTRA